MVVAAKHALWAAPLRPGAMAGPSRSTKHGKAPCLAHLEHKRLRECALHARVASCSAGCEKMRDCEHTQLARSAAAGPAGLLGANEAASTVAVVQLGGSRLNFPHFKRKAHVNGKCRSQLALESRLLRVASTAAGWAGPPRPLSPPRTPGTPQPVRPSAQQLACSKAALQIVGLGLLSGTQLHSKKAQKSRPQPGSSPRVAQQLASFIYWHLISFMNSLSIGRLFSAAWFSLLKSAPCFVEFAWRRIPFESFA